MASPSANYVLTAPNAATAIARHYAVKSGRVNMTVRPAAPRRRLRRRPGASVMRG